MEIVILKERRYICKRHRGGIHGTGNMIPTEFFKKECGISFAYIIHNNGPRTKP